MPSKPKLLVFASGNETGGGSGFEKLIKATRSGVLDATIVGVVSNHLTGGVWVHAMNFGIPFLPFRGPWTAEAYQRIARDSGADYFALSGWLKLVQGLGHMTTFNPRTVFNIHPGPLPRFGGKGMHGHHVHEAVLAAFRAGKINYSEVCMHFVTDEYDKGPVFFRQKVPIYETDTPETLAVRVNAQEHRWQAPITNLVVTGQISWNGVDPQSLSTPVGYSVTRDY